jgi:hypothetical protein
MGEAATGHKPACRAELIRARRQAWMARWIIAALISHLPVRLAQSLRPPRNARETASRTSTWRSRLVHSDSRGLTRP